MISIPPLYSHPRVVAFQDIDAAGIVFFARIFEYFHDAYVAQLAARGVQLADTLRSRAWGAPLVHAEADYRKPMHFGDRIDVDIVSATLGDTSMTVHYSVRAGSADARELAVGKTVHVFIDPSTGTPRAIPPEVRAAFSAPVPTA